MADSAYVRVSARYAKDGIYNTPLYTYEPDDFYVPEPSDGFERQMTIPLTPRNVIPASTFTALQCVAIKNTDAENYIDVSYSYTDAALVVHANVVKVLPGGHLVLPGGINVGTAVTAVAYGASVIIELAVIGQ